jgi:hypothetical protein
MTILLVSFGLQGFLNVANGVISVANASDNVDSLSDLLLFVRECLLAMPHNPYHQLRVSQ